MKRHFHKVFLPIFAILLCQGAKAEERPFTLPDAIAYALEHSGLIAAARLSTEALEAKLRQADWAQWPHASLKALLAPMPRQWGDPLKGGTDLSDWGLFAYTEISGTLPLYTFGKIANLKKAAEAGIDIGRAREEVARAETVYRVKTGFYALSLAQELLEVVREGRDYLEKARRHLEDLEKAEDPSYDPVDKMKLRVFDVQVQARELQARRAKNMAEAGLRVALGLDPNSPVTFVVFPPKALELPKDLSLDSLISQAVENRPEIKALRAALRAREAEVALKRAAFFPNLVLVGRFSYGYSNVADPQSSPFANDPFNSYAAGGGVGLEMDLEIGKKLGELREAQAEAEKVRQELEEARRGIGLEVTKIWAEVQDALALMAAREDAVSAARGWVIAKSDLYDNGLCDMNDLLTALVQFFQARLDHLQAIYDFNVAVAALERSLGFSLTRDE